MTSISTEPWDKVYTVNDYWDGPKLGVAEFHGKPHIYQKQFDAEKDDYTDQFLLSEIEPTLLGLVLEKWKIWLRWNTAYRRGEVDIKTHPALPEERSRHDELVRLIGDRMRADPEHGIIRWARFNASAQQVQWFDSSPEARRPGNANLESQFSDWSFSLDEISAGVYRVCAKHRLGPSIELTGTDPDALLEKARLDACRIDHDMNKQR